jgi:hypothetical protein
MKLVFDLFRVSLQQRLYIRAHPVVFWLCIGLLIQGFIGLCLPFLLLQSAVSQALPNWLERVFYTVYMVGGGMSVAAQLRGTAKLEAAGMSLLGTAFVVQFSSVIYLLHGYFWQGLFLLFLSIGAYQRSRFLGLVGYPTRTVELDGGD